MRHSWRKKEILYDVSKFIASVNLKGGCRAEILSVSFLWQLKFVRIKILLKMFKLLVLCALVACCYADSCCVSQSAVDAWEDTWVTSAKSDEAKTPKASAGWNGCSRLCNSQACRASGTCSRFACVGPSACNGGADASGLPYCGPYKDVDTKSAEYCLKKDPQDPSKYICSKAVPQAQTC